MHTSRSALAATFFVSILLVSGCERPELPSERDHRAERESRDDSESASRSTSESTAQTTAQNRTIENFDSIELRGAAELIINVGPAASLNLEASERRLKHVDTRVSGDTLVIDVTKSRGWLSEHGPLKIVVTTPSLELLESNGAGDIQINGLNGGDHELRLAGAHNVKAEGRVDKLTIELSGAGNVNYHKVVAGDAHVTVNGAGNVEVHATQSLRAEVNGVGAVRYSGDPAKVESELHGLGAITRRDDKLSDKD